MITNPKEIVQKMRPYGEMFSYSEVKNYLMKHNPEEEFTKEIFINYYICMNMYYNDAIKIAELYNLKPIDFCYNMAITFIEDEDGRPNKIEHYFEE